MPVVMLLGVLAVLAGVVVVATGRGGEMSQESADYAPLDLGKVSATDVVLLRPPTTVWGYSMHITEEALDKIATAIRERDVRIIALEQRIADLTGPEHYAPRPPGSVVPGIGLRRVAPPVRPVTAPPPAPLPGPAVPGPSAAETAPPVAAPPVAASAEAAAPEAAAPVAAAPVAAAPEAEAPGATTVDDQSQDDAAQRDDATQHDNAPRQADTTQQNDDAAEHETAEHETAEHEQEEADE